MEYGFGDKVAFIYGGKVHCGIIVGCRMVDETLIEYVVTSEEFPNLVTISESRICKVKSEGIKKEDNVKELHSYEIVDYKIFNNKAVVFTFADGTEERAVCDPKDQFDLERAVEVGIVKKKLGGSNAYNTLVKKAMNQIKAVDKRKAAEKAEEELKAHRRQKDIERKIKRKEKKRLEQIEIQKEAFLKAMMEYDECVANIQTETLS